MRAGRRRRPMTAAVLTVNGLVKTFSVGGGLFASHDMVHALSDVSFDLVPAETLAIVGESGCGKSTLARCLVGLTSFADGTLVLNGRASGEFLRQDFLGFHRFI